MQLATLQALARYWASDYDLGRVEARLNAVPQFTTEIDGISIHFIHVRSPHEHALPLIITHGWPGSVIELLEAVGPLTDPTAHGGGAEDAFDLVLPSLPGYGFSAQPTAVGWHPGHIAQAWADTLYWLTGTGASAARSYWEGGRAAAQAAAVGQASPPVSLPVGFTVFPGEIFRAPRSWVERAYPNLVYFNEADQGGHFAAWEEPQLFSSEVRAAFQSLR